MALLKKGFKKFGHEDVRTEYFACDANHKAPAADNADLVYSHINKLDACLPAGAVIKFDGTSKAAISAGASDITAANINTSVFLLAEDFHVEDGGFVYYVVENISNLEDRA